MGKHGDDIDPNEVKEDEDKKDHGSGLKVGVAQETDEEETVTNNVHLTVYAKNLRMPTSLLKGKKVPSAYAILKSNNHDNTDEKFLGQTEVVPTTISPQWITPLNVDFDDHHGLTIEIWNEEERGNEKLKYKTATKMPTKMGEVKFNLLDLMRRPGNNIERKMCGEGKHEGKHTGMVYIEADPYDNEDIFSSELKIDLINESLSIAGKRNRMIFIQISEKTRSTSDGMEKPHKPIYRSSPPILESSSNVWNDIMLSYLPGFKGFDIEISLWESKMTGIHKLLGRCETTISNLDGTSEDPIELESWLLFVSTHELMARRKQRDVNLDYKHLPQPKEFSLVNNFDRFKLVN